MVKLEFFLKKCKENFAYFLFAQKNVRNIGVALFTHSFSDKILNSPSQINTTRGYPKSGTRTRCSCVNYSTLVSLKCLPVLGYSVLSYPLPEPDRSLFGTLIGLFIPKKSVPI
ncbi:hypothetical protein [Niabella hibiscisoli]|uniref:hypothetical protein n=1 Tax=Niabella hibiscisoli TaxID=1825928 RepID=UPI001F0D1FDE|nr:hypothetical protein [Niabella hibiscisoli]MCH5715832.1 hypothetical protein [Niabella hibiscisoli]